MPGRSRREGLAVSSQQTRAGCWLSAHPGTGKGIPGINPHGPTLTGQPSRKAFRTLRSRKAVGEDEELVLGPPLVDHDVRLGGGPGGGRLSNLL